MSKLVLHIQFASPASLELMHRALNFIEDVCRDAKDAQVSVLADAGVRLLRTSAQSVRWRSIAYVSLAMVRANPYAEAARERGGIRAQPSSGCASAPIS